MTIILQENEIKKCVDINTDLIPIIEEAFVCLTKGLTIMPPILRLDIKENHGEVDVKTAYIKGLDSFAIKVSPGFFNNPSLNLPTTSGMMILLDSKTGILKSVLLDKGYLTNVRTAIAGAIAAKHLSNKDISTVGIIGAGIQAKLQLKALMLVRKPTIAYVWGRNDKKVKQFITDNYSELKIKLIQSHNPEEVCKKSDVLITTTPSTEPLIKSEWIRKGTHITAMGSDAEHKNELDPKIVQECDLYIADNQSQTTILGELHHAIKAKLISSEKIFTELGSVINKDVQGRSSKDAITVCDLTGTGVQDTAIARYTFNLAMKNNFGLQLN